MGYVNDYDLAQDLAQETFILVWQKLESLRNESSIGTWIFRIVTKHCLRWKKEKILKQNFQCIFLRKGVIEPQIQFFIYVLQRYLRLIEL
jgi:RNA polymerase sigma-70 factor (ECF subfamily)